MTRKFYRLTTTLALAAMLTTSIPAFSASNSCRVNMQFAGVLNGTHLAAGRYDIAWQAHSPALTVTVAQGKTVIATVQARMEERSNKFHRNMVVYTERPDGSLLISEVRVGGTNQAIVFSE